MRGLVLPREFADRSIIVVSRVYIIMVQTVKYEVLKKLGNVEVRHYPRLIVAKVDNREVDSFGVLFSFISGQNIQKKKVKMTSPVVSQEIKMTSPVLTDFSAKGYMAFVMPEEFTVETVPEPVDARVRIEVVPERVVAVLRFSGGWSEDRFAAKEKELFEELAAAGVRIKGGLFSMLYNPPFTPGFLRRNEVAVEVELE